MVPRRSWYVKEGRKAFEKILSCRGIGNGMVGWMKGYTEWSTYTKLVVFGSGFDGHEAMKLMMESTCIYNLYRRP